MQELRFQEVKILQTLVGIENRERMTFAGLFLRMVGDGSQTGGG